MEEFVRRSNIERLTKQIATTPAGPERDILLKLLAEEKAKRPRPTKSC